MGKGSRNSQQRLEKQLANEEKLLAEKKAKQNKKRSDRIIAITCIVFAILIVAVLVLNVLSETGVFIRATDAMSQGDIVVDAAMMTFFVNDHITNWYNNYYVYVMYGLISLDMSKDLKTQKLTANDANYMGDSSLAGKTWYDYFMDTVIENVEMYITYATAAKKADITLSADDKSEIDETIKDLKASLKEYKMTFADQYGKGVTESDVRKCYELIYLASNYGEKFQADTEARLEAEEGKTTILSYPDDNKGQFYSAEYLSYTISVSEKKLGTQKAYDDAVKEAKAAAQKIAEAKTPADFVKLVEEYKESLKTETSTSTATGTEKETKTEAATKPVVETESTDPADQYKETIYYETDDELGKWIFDETNEPETGDVKVIEETSTEKVTEKATSASKETGTKKETSTEKETSTGKTDSAEKETDKDGKIVYENFKVTVYMITELPHLDETKTHNMAYMISDNKVAAEAFLKEFRGSEKKNRDVFEELAKKQYDKLFEGHDHENHEEGEVDPVFNYAQADQAKEKYFADDYNALNKWLDDEARKDNDYTAELIKISITGSDKKVTTYYAALYFEGHDEDAWYVDAFAGATQKEIDDWYKAELAKKLISYNMDAIADIALVRYSTGQ